MRVLNTKQKNNSRSRGLSLYLAVVIMTVLMSIAFGMSTILVGRLKNLETIGDSVVAFYAADSGIEQALKNSNDATYSATGYLDLNGNGMQDSADSTYEVHGIANGVQNCPVTYDYCVKAVGTYRTTKRTIGIMFK